MAFVCVIGLQVAGIFDVEEVGSPDLHPVYQCSDVAVYRLKPCPSPALYVQEGQRPSSPKQGTRGLPDSKRARKLVDGAGGQDTVEGMGKRNRGSMP